VGESYEILVRLEPATFERLRQTGLEVMDQTAEQVRLRRASG
jgi:hypothetical protein